MAKKPPLYPHVPKAKAVQFPHGESKISVIGTGTGRMRSGTEGWISVTILDYSDILFTTPGGVVTRGGVEKYRVRFEEGKHKGDIQWVPANYVEVFDIVRGVRT